MMNKKIILISTNAGERMGGEAIKVYQFFMELSRCHPHVTLVTHARCREQLAHLMGDHDIRLIEDDTIMLFLWRSKVLRFLVSMYFHLKVRLLIPRICPRNAGNILHYVCPISPVVPRFPPSGYRTILGPLNGNIGYPSEFSNREGMKSRIVQFMQRPVQTLLRFVLGEKSKYHRILVSGYDRTRTSLRWSGAREDQLTDVVDSGISAELFTSQLMVHEGRNPRFLCSGRFVDYKGIDLAIRAIAQAPADVVLDVFGDGEMANPWKRLTEELGVADRVFFRGWCSHDELMQRMREYRGYLFPTLAEANGIVMQEAMAIGLPVVTLRWGGPEGLADDTAAIFIEPNSQDHVVCELAVAIERLAAEPEVANTLARNARKTADQHFPWSSVCAEWTKDYLEGPWFVPTKEREVPQGSA